MEKHHKQFVLNNLLGYRRAQTVMKIGGVDFYESKFVIRLDQMTFPVTKGVSLSVGDLCQVDTDYLNNLSVGASTGPYKYQGKYPIGGKSRLIAFVRMCSQNTRDTFCALQSAGDPSKGHILESKNGSLLLFWPECLIKIEV